MQQNLILLTILCLLGCAEPIPAIPPESPGPQQAVETKTTAPGWSLYHSDPAHPWNRVIRQLYRRVSAEGKEYGSTELDPLLWLDTTHLLTGSSHEQAIQVLDEFLSTGAETLIRDPLRRAMFQRDLWAVFDWAAWQAEPYAAERQTLTTRLVQIMKRVALSDLEIRSLPDNYALAIGSRIYAGSFQAGSPETAFLPAELFQEDGAWVPLGREGGPAAMTHTEAFPFFGRSVFLVYVRSPAGREATLDFISSLRTEPDPVTASGSEVALVRQMLLIDDQGEMVLSPLVETIQLRHFSPAQSFYEFELDRARLFENMAGGLAPKSELLMLFMGHGDVFENSMPESQASIPEICKACHFEHPPIPNSGNTRSIISYSRQPFSLPDHESAVLFATTRLEEAGTVIAWKKGHVTWQSLETIWNASAP